MQLLGHEWLCGMLGLGFRGLGFRVIVYAPSIALNNSYNTPQYNPLYNPPFNEFRLWLMWDVWVLGQHPVRGGLFLG